MVSDPHPVSSLSYSETLLRKFYSFANTTDRSQFRRKHLQTHGHGSKKAVEQTRVATAH